MNISFVVWIFSVELGARPTKLNITLSSTLFSADTVEASLLKWIGFYTQNLCYILLHLSRSLGIICWQSSLSRSWLFLVFESSSQQQSKVNQMKKKNYEQICLFFNFVVPFNNENANEWFSISVSCCLVATSRKTCENLIQFFILHGRSWWYVFMFASHRKISNVNDTKWKETNKKKTVCLREKLSNKKKKGVEMLPHYNTLKIKAK